jgi:hypothetical protein
MWHCVVLMGRVVGILMVVSGAFAVRWPGFASAAVIADPVLVAAGDIACDPTSADFNGGHGTVSPPACQAAATAAEIKSIAPNYLLPLGDEQYIDGAAQGTMPPLSYYSQSYNATWGALASTQGGVVPNANIHPVAGNHEYGDLNESGSGPYASGANYFTNFGPNGLKQLPSSVTGPTNDWYSYNIAVNGGRWHIVALDSECGVVGGCGSGSPEETWFARDLAANAGVCTLVAWHQPRWASGPIDSDANYTAFWNDAVAHQVAIVLNGHAHLYQHFAPMDANGNAVPKGTSEFIVGTGGENLETAAPNSPPALIAQDDADFGVLKLALHATNASYAFQTTSGTVPDAGTVACPTGSGGSVSAPTVSSVSPVAGPASGGVAVVIAGTNFVAGATVKFGSVSAAGVTVVSSSQITAVAPAGSATVDVTVTNSAGTSPTGVADEYSYTSATNGYSVNLAATSTTAAVGASVGLTASANVDVGPTPYGIWVYDVTANTVIGHVGSGTSMTVVVSQSVASTHRYVAYIANTGPTNIQSASNPQIITWA